MKIVADCRIRNGQLQFCQRTCFLSDVAKMKDGDYILTIEKRKNKRSLNQNRYYWKVVVPLVKSGLYEIGYSLPKEEVHNHLKAQFHIVEFVNERTGEILKTIGSTTEMTKSQMMDYFAEITQWAAEYLNVQIPQPNEQLMIEME